MRKIIALLLCAAIVLGASPIVALASPGDPNIDGGGGGMGTGTSNNFWNPGNDGVRITVVAATTGAAASAPMDFSNRDQPGSISHFGKVNKLQYLAGTPLTLQSGAAYQCFKPAYSMPSIISSGGRSNIEAIRRYFCSEYAVMMVADAAGFDYENLISGEYKLLLEPIAYFTFNGQRYAMTATEAALYDQLANGALRSRLPSLTHQNLPLAMFLETPDLGLPAYSGARSGRQTNEAIISSLGMGIVSFAEEHLEIPEPGEADVEYRVNTEVVTSVTLNALEEINPDDPATVRFIIAGTTYTINSIVVPAGGTQLVWVKWTTPATEQTITITVSASHGFLSENIIVAKIVDLDQNPPPDPLATDRNDRFVAPALPIKAHVASASWSVWWAQWHPFWVWIENWVTYYDSWSYTDAEGNTSSGSSSYSVDEGWWEDHGWWDFFSDDYAASLAASSVVSPDERVPTAVGKLMKSGYGINNRVAANFSTNAPASHVAPAQTAVSWFPEFQYETYWRLLERTSGAYMAQLDFRRNPYSLFDRRAHFTPVWYPDGTYMVYTWLLDAWTPAGMLSMNLNDYVNISGSLFDDWYTNRE
jgi:hypothetical protein